MNMSGMIHNNITCVLLICYILTSPFCEISTDNQHVSRYLSWLIYEIIVKSDNLIFLNNLVSKYNRYWIEMRIIIHTQTTLSLGQVVNFFFELFSIDLWKMLCLKLSITSRGIIIFAHHKNLIDGLARISIFFLNQNVWAHLHLICWF